MECPKCGKTSGDDWSQCLGGCPMPISPYYSPSREELDKAEIALIAETGFSAEEIAFEREYCCCGDRVDCHGFGSGHAAVPVWDHRVWEKAGGSHG